MLFLIPGGNIAIGTITNTIRMIQLQARLQSKTSSQQTQDSGRFSSFLQPQTLMNAQVHVFFHTKFVEKLPPQEFCNVTCLKCASQATGPNLLKALPQQVHLTVTLSSRFYAEV